MSEFKLCPKCNSESAEKMSFTWWGGLIGPKILSHVKCGSCGAQFNGKTGRDNTTGIVIYVIAVSLILVVFMIIVIALVIAFAALN